MSVFACVSIWAFMYSCRINTLSRLCVKTNIPMKPRCICKCVCACLWNQHTLRTLGCLKHQQSACQMKETSIWMRIQRLGERYVWCGNEWFKVSGHHLVLQLPHFSCISFLILDQCQWSRSISLFTPSCTMCWIVLIWAAVRLSIGLPCSCAAICSSIQFSSNVSFLCVSCCLNQY